MLAPAILSLLLGLSLAQRFNVFVLIPVILLIVIFALAGALAHRDAALISALTATVAIVSLQIGYLLGIGISYRTLRGRARRLVAASLRSLPPLWRAH
jgi:hypothetical protein